PAPTPAANPAAVAPQGLAPDAAAMGWSELRSAVEACEACGLCRTRNRTVFGAGPQEARWLVVGEAPGADEDASGEPFVGQAGRLLDAMLAAIDLDRARNVFIANVVKCRPPGNRNPLPDEAASCLPYLRRQIELLSPDLVLLLGRVAAHSLLETDAGVGSLRGRVHRLRVGAREIPAVVTWHPSYLLRRPEDKALAWADLCLARESFEAGRGGGAGG
ncbi:MAG TPA: uracil-DNA glycosylase, partial [Quisquiliibacterium sp.]|nr:uracil-DNA glycosylase [Quisquiliibacterium sp.]